MKGNDTPSLFGAEYPSSQAVLLLNLGSPRTPAVEDVHAYLLQFLMDRRIIGLPHWARHLLVHHIIVPKRAPKSAANYRTIWDEERQAFPLITHTEEIACALAERRQCPVAVGMRYASPSTGSALEALASLLSVEEIIIAPLYPHYARSSYETAVAYVLEEARRLGLSRLRFRLLSPFYNEPSYRAVLTESIRPYLQSPFDRLIVSMHGIPVSHIPKECREHNGETNYCASRRDWHERHAEEDCYRLQCEETTEYLRQDLGLERGQVELVYQSRLGRHEWMRPYMSQRVRQFSGEGAERVVVVCPGFICDCLETIQEIDSYYREVFLAHGGKSFVYVPCLNSSEDFIASLASLLDQTALDPSALLSEENKRKYKYEH